MFKSFLAEYGSSISTIAVATIGLLLTKDFIDEDVASYFIVVLGAFGFSTAASKKLVKKE